MDNSPPYAPSGRRRITRTTPALDDNFSTASSSQAGPSRLPDLTQLVDVNFSEIGKNMEDTESDDHSTPRLPNSNKLPPSAGETPAARLRALLSLVPNHSTPTPVPPPPPPPESISEYESDFDKGESINATASMARESLRDVFSRALRAPGGTPQKQRRRSNSIDPSDLDSPRAAKERSKIKAKRKSLSDEDVENSYRSTIQSQSSYKTRGQPLTLEVLQQRYMNSKSNRDDDDDALSSSDKHDRSDDAAELLRELNSSKTSPPAATSTPQHSLHMSVGFQDQLQSNLLDQDSEMQRFIEGLDSFEEQHVTQPNVSNGMSSPHHSEYTVHPVHDTPKNDHPAQTSPSRLPVPTSSRKTVVPKTPEVQHHRERLWSFPKASRPLTPNTKPHTDTSSTGKTPLTSRSLAALSRMTSSPSLSRGSSRAGSVTSNAERREGTPSLERDELQQRERLWGKPTSALPHRNSNMRLTPPHSGERPRTHSVSSTDSLRSQNDSPSASQSLRRHSSHTSVHSLSPTGSAFEEEIHVPEVHERERNWNSPRPVWHDYRRPESPALSGDGDSPHSHSQFRTRTTSLSSIGNSPDNSHNPSSTASTSASRARHHSSAGPSRPLRGHTSSPSIYGKSSIHTPSPPVSPSIRRQSSTASLRPPTDDQKTSRLSKTPSSLANKLRTASKPSPSNSSSVTQNLSSRTARPNKSSKVSNSSVTSLKAFPEKADDISESDTSSSNLVHPPAGLTPQEDDQDDAQSQELTPTLRTVAPPPSDSPERSNATAFPSDHSENDEPFQQDRDAPSGSVLPEMASSIGTPPRHPSGSSLRLQFTSPSPPRELPPLPDPPSTDDESNGSPGWSNPRPARLFETTMNSVVKTPKAPGAWMDTPAPVRRPRSYSDTSLRKDSFEGDGTHPPPAGSNFSTMQTPKPPGGWLATPGPSKVQYVDQSVETDTEPDTEPEVEMVAPPIGLATPTSSLSKAYRNQQTPAAPGAWIQTPASRKSVMTVRFDPDANETREFKNGGSDTSASEALNSPSTLQTQTVSPPVTPEIEGSSFSPSVRKTPNIRVLDAYGNEQPREREKPRIRMVDALGQAIEEDSLQEADSSINSIPPGSRDELLSRVRRGLNDLVQEIHDMDRAAMLSSSELSRVKELDSVSLNAREKRRRLSGDLKKNNDEFRDKFSSLRASMQKNPLPDSSTTSDPSRFSIRSPRFLILFALQILLALFMYHLSTSKAKELFLTTYYDPFYPDLHLSLFRTQLFLSTSPERYVSWFTLYDLLREQGLKACASQVRDNLAITVSNLQSFAWERWGVDGASQNLAWPPT